MLVHGARAILIVARASPTGRERYAGSAFVSDAHETSRLTMPWPKLRVPSHYAGAAVATVGVRLLLLPGWRGRRSGWSWWRLAFWLWARSLPDRAEQLARWGWLRRPPMALWLAAALFMALPELKLVFSTVPAAAPSGLYLCRPRSCRRRCPCRATRCCCCGRLASLAVLWAGLELMAALPLSRPFPDLTGPARRSARGSPPSFRSPASSCCGGRPRLWTRGAAGARDRDARAHAGRRAGALLRAFSRALAHGHAALARWCTTRRSRRCSWRATWCTARSPALLWLGAAGGRLIALAAELRGQAARRGTDAHAAVASRLAGRERVARVAAARGRRLLRPRTSTRIEYVVLAAPGALASALWL